MPNIRLDLTGKTYGCLVVEGYDADSYGDKNSRWLCRCSNCGNTSSVTAQHVKKGPKSCVHCKMLYREYPTHKLSCTVCGAAFVHNNKVKTGQCSDKCKRRAIADRMMSTRRGSLEGMVHSLLVQVRSRAKRKNLAFDLTDEWAMERLNLQEFMCARTGTPLTKSLRDSSGLRGTPYSTLSFDRINSNEGYTKSNTNIVCHQYNVAKNKFSEEEFMNLCKLVLQNAGYDVTRKEGRSP